VSRYLERESRTELLAYEQVRNPLNIVNIPSNAVRLPEPVQGTATVVDRYRRPQAVVLHPSDFERLVQDGKLADSLGRPDPLPPPTALARKAHLHVDTPGAEAPALEDGDALEALLAQPQT
jgi:hypothetical protein